MLNELTLEGRILKITYRNQRVLNFIVAQEFRMSHIKLNLTCFHPELFEYIVDNINNVMLFKGTFAPNNYKNKNGDWVNTYCISVDTIEPSEFKPEDTMIDDNEISFCLNRIDVEAF